MKIRQLTIERFRGIKHLDWKVDGDLVCLVGPGDATKTTILDAIEFVLSPRWNLPFEDIDFFDVATEDPIVITVTVGDLSEDLKSDAKYGHLTRGWAPSGELHDEPEDGDELALSVRLRVGSSLEPSWAVVNDRVPEGRPISAPDRERLGCARLGEYLDRHFAWGRGSILSRLTEKATELPGVLASAGRAARAALDSTPADKTAKLSEAAQRAKSVGADFGVAAVADYAPRLDVQAITLGSAGLSLHEGPVPLRRKGLATRRLLAIAMQREAVKAGGAALIDEVEHGLEPHRIRHLVRQLRVAQAHAGVGQVFMTTHAPTVLAELSADEVRIVRTENGGTKILKPDPALQPMMLKASEAFFAKKVLVCEGMTELGLCRRLDQWWNESGQSFGLAAVALADGKGDEAPKVAASLAALEYSVALLCDSDKLLNPDPSALKALGVLVLQWDGGLAAEERFARDLPWEGVAAMVQLAMGLYGEQAVCDAVAGRLHSPHPSLTGDPANWPALLGDELSLRGAIGLAAKKHRIANGREGWFKRAGLGEELAGILVEYHAAIAATDSGVKIAAIRKWVYGGG